MARQQMALWTMEARLINEKSLHSSDQRVAALVYIPKASCWLLLRMKGRHCEALRGEENNRRLAEPPKVEHSSNSKGQLPRSNLNDFPMGILLVLVRESQGGTKVWV